MTDEEVVRTALVTIEDLRSKSRTEAWTTQDGPAELHEALLSHRRALDAMESSLVALQRAHARARDAWADARNVLEDAETRSDQLRQEFSTAKERDIHLRAQTVEERVALRRAERRRDTFWDALEVGRTRYRGLDASRRDLETRIRLLTLTTTLER